MHRRAGDEQVGQHGADHRPGRGRAQQRHQQRHAHEAGVGEGRHQGAEGGVLQVHLSLERHGDREEHDQQPPHSQVDGQHGRVQHLQHRRVGTEAEQQARQREVQHEGVEPRDGAFGQHVRRAAR
jgi:hypothetical protein